jgi:hypothetical protein
MMRISFLSLCPGTFALESYVQLSPWISASLFCFLFPPCFAYLVLSSSFSLSLRFIFSDRQVGGKPKVSAAYLQLISSELSI